MRRPWQSFDVFQQFHTIQVDSCDVDPVYPVLSRVLTGATAEQRMWAALLHVAYYDLGSALAVYAACPTPRVPPEALLRLPCGTERRAHRDPRVLARHLAALTDLYHLHGGLTQWLGDVLHGGYPAANATLMSVWGNGRWASYKSCELLAHVMHAAEPAWAGIIPTDMGHANSSGPRHGLELLLLDLPTGNTPTAIAYLDAVSADLCADLSASGADGTVCTVETSLCDFHGLANGRYYPGHDIDQMQTQLDRTRSDLTDAAFGARIATLPHTYLGELNGWHGVETKRLRRHYLTTGTLTTRHAYEKSTR